MKILIVEDSDDVRERIQTMVSDIPGIRVVGYAVDEPEALEQVNALLPDVVTLDLKLKEGSGISVLKAIKQHHPEIKVMVLANDDGRYYEEACMRAGADCFFDKTFQFSRAYSALWLWSNANRSGNLSSTLLPAE